MVQVQGLYLLIFYAELCFPSGVVCGDDDPDPAMALEDEILREGIRWLLQLLMRKIFESYWMRRLYKSYIIQSLLFNEGKYPVNSTHWVWSSRTNMIELVPQENTISQSLILSIEIKFQHFHWASYFKDKILSVLSHIGNKIKALFLWLRNFPASWTW